ncbi:MAG: Holliday junction resolvase RuvX [Oscillospiraceae bacterium]|nr:Holliday junction resolvase RuvX [Oscillospiraceae bacterium]
MRIIGIDYGDARVGVAVSDLLGLTAQGIRTINNRSIKQLLSELKEILDEYNPEKIVIGLPKNMDGSEGFRAEATYKFAENLKKIYTGEIIFVDERLSSLGAKRYLSETNTFGQKRKNVLDTVAACIILEGYLNSHKNN